MRPVLRLLGTRYGIALLLMLLVLGVVGLTRAVSGPGFSTPPADSADGPAASPLPPGTGDDGLHGSASPAPPSTSPGAPTPSEIATAFARAWLDHDGVTAEQWREKLARYATKTLLDQFAETDPAGVPASRITGPIRLESRGATFVEAVVPVDSGTLRLSLLGTDGRWLVDAVDWERA